MSPKLIKNKFIRASAGLSLWLVDTLEAMRYDSYVREFLRDSNINYQKYTLVFGFNYDDATQKMWQVFLFSKENKWELIDLPNPFYKVKLNAEHFSPEGDETQNTTVTPIDKRASLFIESN